jgi:large subunit ribosomal protein L35
MPKQKTKKAAAKRFKVTANGRIRRGRVRKNSGLEKTSSKRSRKYRKESEVAQADVRRVKDQLTLR